MDTDDGCGVRRNQDGKDIPAQRKRSRRISSPLLGAARDNRGERTLGRKSIPRNSASDDRRRFRPWRGSRRSRGVRGAVRSGVELEGQQRCRSLFLSSLVTDLNCNMPARRRADVVNSACSDVYRGLPSMRSDDACASRCSVVGQGLGRVCGWMETSTSIVLIRVSPRRLAARRVFDLKPAFCAVLCVLKEIHLG